MSIATPPLLTLFDTGKGRSYVIVSETESKEFLQLAEALAVAPSAGRSSDRSSCGRTVLLRCPSVTGRNLNDLIEQLCAKLSELKIRQASFLGIGDVGVLLQQLVLKVPKQVRSLVLVDAVTRPHPTKFEQLLDRIEARLPLGLPFRIRSRGAYLKPFLQKIRCPVLIVRTDRSSRYLDSESQVLTELLPTAWYTEWNRFPDCERIVPIIEDFQEVPAKCPQKGVRRA